MGVKQVILPAYLSHTSLLISLDHFADQTVMKYCKSHTTSAGTRSYSWVQTAWRNNQPDAQQTQKCLIHQAWPSLPNPFSPISFLGFYFWVINALECVLFCPRDKKEWDFKRRGLRLRPISPDITNEISCLGTCNVSLPSGILIITHTKPPHQSNWILERKLKVSKAINSAAALFVCLSEY